MQNIANWIVTATSEGEMWHRQSSLAWVDIGFRGLGRWHDCESIDDAGTRRDLSKYITDHFEIIPSIELSSIQKATVYNTQFASIDFLITHLEHWLAREREYIKYLKNHIKSLSDQQHYTLYRMLCSYLEEVENEVLYVKILYKCLKHGNSSHHTVRIMDKLHDYFENDYKGGMINFTIT